MARLVERQRERRVTTVEFSVEIEAPPDRVWEVTSDPGNLPHWDKHIERVWLPSSGLGPGARYSVRMRFMTIRADVDAEVLEWEPPWLAKVRLSGLLDATVTTTIASLPFDRALLRQEAEYSFKGPLGRFGAMSLAAVGGAHLALRHGVLSQKREIEGE
ncbi:MAG: SRPBCC family protein [Actinobacteria bacterium]|nr:SRPBCC family protein [Actinomycetota bacterium]